MRKPFNESLLLSILAQPSSPFREAHVIRRIREVLDQNGVPYFTDPIGNLILGVSSKKEYLALTRKASPEPLRVFIAHMDHPGFHGVSWRTPSQLEVMWHGGSPTQHLENSRVWLANSKDSLGYGKLRDVKMLPSGRAIKSGIVDVPTGHSLRNSDATQIFGGFAFREPVWKEGELLYTKAADDLVGAFSILSLAIERFGRSTKKNQTPFIGLLTRAEEVGFIGAIGHFELGWLSKSKRKVLCVSLETSRTLPGAEIGKGPVVRLGDKYTVFSAGATRVFTELAIKSLPDAHQRRVMDGGTCEGTAATVYGFDTVAISVPLGNYHNQSFEGGPDSVGPLGPAPEFVHLQDVKGLLALCRDLLSPGLPWATPWLSKHKEFKKELKRYQPLLKSGREPQ